ncbi:MAG: M36 family metallopeptidase, partial [Flavisolibacter sp.]
STDWWNVRIDAISGDVLEKDNWTLHEQNDKQPLIHKSNNYSAYNIGRVPANKINSNSTEINPPPNVTNAGYNVIPFPQESLTTGSLSVDNNPWLKAGSGNNATTNGWHFDGTSNYTYTRGNNVYAYQDSDNHNVPGASVNSTTSAPSLTFNFTPDFAKEPYNINNLDLALTNLFYWNNLMHDISYQYGFTESGGNFQNDNLGRGGTSGDYVNAEAQDGGGFDNANFTTPVDGLHPRMQMYLFSTQSSFVIFPPAPFAGTYHNLFAESSFKPGYNALIKTGAVTGQVLHYNDPSDTTHLACSGPPSNSLAGKIAMIDRGGCSFIIKVKNAQDAGAIAVIVVNNVASPSVITMSGTDSSIIIPAVMVSQSNGAVLATELNDNLNVTIDPGIYFDGDLDNTIICHEYTHGISNRLTGGPANTSCLFNAEQAGEGWSDYMALMVTTNWGTAQLTDDTTKRTLGNYVFGEPVSGPGIRRVPYTTDMTVDTLTYKSMDGNSNQNGEVHNIGEIWCSAIWDMTWNIIKQEGSINSNLYDAQGGGGNTIALNLVMEGLKLQTCSPGFLDSRDAILAADSILYNNRHKCSIWNAFARRGMGISASQGSSNSTGDHITAFDVPGGVFISKSSAPIQSAAGNHVTLTIKANCNCQVPLSNYSIRDTIPNGFSYVNSTGGTLNGNVVTIPVSFTTALDSANYSVTLLAASGQCAIDTAINDDRDAHLTGGFTSTSFIDTASWRSSSVNPYSGTNSWFASDRDTFSNFVLTSAPFTAGSLSIFSFWHSYYLETGFDGGRVEYSKDGGTTWLDAAPFIIQNNYNNSMESTPWGIGNKTFSGSSNGYVNTIVDFSSFSGQSLKVRFQIQSDTANPLNSHFDGWFIDDILQMNGCGGSVKSGLYDNTNQLLNSAAMPVFITPPASPLPLQLLSFTARAAGKRVILHWITASELNTKNFDVEYTSDGQKWKNIGTVKANGNGSGDYNYLHESPVQGENYYRLKQIDVDGKFTYSPVRLLQIVDKNITDFSLLPNPASSQTILYFNQILNKPDIYIYNSSGQVVRKFNATENISSFTINTSALPVGTYMIGVHANGGMIFKKLLIAK